MARKKNKRRRAAVKIGPERFETISPDLIAILREIKIAADAGKTGKARGKKPEAPADLFVSIAELSTAALGLMHYKPIRN